MAARTVLVTAAPPNPNGDLHLGHLSGPFLGADVLTRHLRQRGRRVLYVSYTDDLSPFVLRKAEEIDRARRDAVSAEVETVREPVKPERVEVRVEQHLGDARRRRVPLERGVDVLAGQLQHASHGVH